LAATFLAGVAAFFFGARFSFGLLAYGLLDHLERYL
jgi:hypothetical protein